MKHLEGQGYWKHLGCAVKWAYSFCVAGVLGFVHAVFPFLWKDLMSNTASRIHREIQSSKRKKKRGR